MYRIIVTMLLLACSSLSLTMKRDNSCEGGTALKLRKSETGERIAGISTTTQDGLYRALELVVLNNQVNSLKKLLEREVEQKILNKCLVFACQRGFNDIVSVLLAAGADPNTCTEKTRIPVLLLAAQGGHTQVVSLLLGAGADKDATNEYEDTALLVATESGYSDLVALLIEAKACVDKQNSLYDTALMVATACGYKDIVKMLIRAGANCDLRNFCGETALTLAAINERTEIAALLVGAGADTTSADNQGKIALQHARDNGCKDVIHLLTLCRDLEMQAYIRNPQAYFSSSSVHYTILLWASMCGHTFIIAQLLELPHIKEVVSGQDERGYTPLMYALLYGHYDSALLLIKASSQEGINLCNKQGKNALFYATIKGNLRLVGALLEAGAEASYNEVKLAAHQKYLQVMGRLLFVVHEAQLPALFK